MDNQKIPNIGEVVTRIIGDREQLDWVSQLRIGDEQSILVWGSNKDRFVVGDQWRPYIAPDIGDEQSQ